MFNLLHISEEQLEEGLLEISVSREDLKSHWDISREESLSLIFGIQFRHYKSAATSDLLSKIHVFFLTWWHIQASL